MPECVCWHVRRPMSASMWAAVLLVARGSPCCLSDRGVAQLASVYQPVRNVQVHDVQVHIVQVSSMQHTGRKSEDACIVWVLTG